MRVVRRGFNPSEERLNRQRALLLALSDDLALPFLQVKSSIEVAGNENYSGATMLEQAKNIHLSSEAGLLLVEAYRMLLKSDQILLEAFEPVAIGAVLEEVAHRLSDYAKEYGVQIQVDVQGRFAPILAHTASLELAIEVLSASIIRAQASQNSGKAARIVLGAHKSSEGLLAAGVFSDVRGLSDKSLRAARSLLGRAHQPLPHVPPGSASGILVADMLCESLWQPLRKSAHRSMDGLATNLPISKQLEFI